MTLSITTRTQMENVIVDLCGRLSYPAPELGERIRSLLDGGTLRFTLEMSGVPYIDSYGLGQLVSIWHLAQSKNASMTIAHPTARVQQLLEITKLNTLLEIV